MKPFKLKYVICRRDANGEAEVSTFTEDNKRNRIPCFFDTPAEAVIEIADHMKCVAEAVQSGDYTEDRLDDAFGDFVAHCSLTKTGNFQIWIPGEHEDEVIYDGKYNSFIISIN